MFVGKNNCVEKNKHVYSFIPKLILSKINRFAESLVERIEIGKGFATFIRLNTSGVVAKESDTFTSSRLITNKIMKY